MTSVTPTQRPANGPASGAAEPAVWVLDDPAAVAERHARGDNAFSRHLYEALGHLRLPYRSVAAVAADPGAPGPAVIVVAELDEVSPATVTALRSWVERGGTLLRTDTGRALDELAGIDARQATSGLVTLDGPWPHHPPHHPPRPLRALAGDRLSASGPGQVWGRWEDGSAAIMAHRVGDGTVVTFGVDLWQTVVRIVQGHPVTTDGAAATDGSAPLDDDILKCEDGLGLDLDQDRRSPEGHPAAPIPYPYSYPPPHAAPVFDLPHADLWVSLFAQTVWWGCDTASRAHAWLHYWPAGVPAMAHMSHDSDGNDDADGQAALDAFAEAGVRVTWCQVYRDNAYSPEIYTAIAEAGHEHALHFNAMADAEHATWGEAQLDHQLAWVQRHIGDQHRIVSNKNHYTRWEGWTEFYRWLEDRGIELDQSRGASKIGSIGMTFGTCHVGFWTGDVDVANRPLDVISMPLHTQDLAWAGHISVRDVILDAAEQVHGVAHFLYHGPHLRKRPATRASCSELTRLARDRGMPWWTARQINRWERDRRGVDIDLRAISAHRWQLTVTSTATLIGAGVLLALPGASTAVTDGIELAVVTRHGHRFFELAADLTPGEHRWEIVADPAAG